MRNICTDTKRTTDAGNTIWVSDWTGQELVIIGNDGYPSDAWGKFTVQCFDGQWNQIENGLMDTEVEAAEAVESLAGEYYDAESLRYIQI